MLSLANIFLGYLLFGFRLLKFFWWLLKNVDIFWNLNFFYNFFLNEDLFGNLFYNFFYDLNLSDGFNRLLFYYLYFDFIYDFDGNLNNHFL